MLKTYGLTHVALASRDPKRAAAFYSSVFACEAVYESHDFVQLQTPGARDVLVFERAPKDAGRRGGVAHIGFRLQWPDESETAVRAVKAAGGTVEQQGAFCPGEPYLFARDLDGYLVEIW